MKRFLFRFIQSIYVQAAIVALAVILVVPMNFDKYRLVLTDKEKTQFREGSGPNSEQYVHDLNGDGTDEYIVSHEYIDRLSVKVSSGELKLYDQYNFQGNFNSRLNKVYFSDMDKDGFAEIWGFTLRNDSVFLNSMEPFDTTKSKMNVEMRFVDKVCRKYYEKDDLIVTFTKFSDIDGDGSDEFVFYLKGGYSLKPRKIYVYYPFKDSLASKSLPGFSSSRPNYLVDLNENGKKEILLSSYASCNVPDTMDLQFTDQHPWLIALTHDLEFLFKPVPYKGKYSKVYVFPYRWKKRNVILVAYGSKGIDGRNSRIELRSLKGELLKTKIFDNEYQKDFSQQAFIDTSSSKHSLIMPGPALLKIPFERFGNMQYHVPENLIMINNIAKRYFWDNLGAGDDKELFGISNDNTGVVVLSTDFRHETTFKIDENDELQTAFRFKTAENGVQLWAIGHRFIYKFNYLGNALFYWKYVVYLGIFGGAFLFIFAIRKLYERQLREKYELKNQVERLKLRTLQNQLDPHFILNTSNSIGSVILTGNTEMAYQAFVRFSGLMRVMLHGNNQIFLTLKKELSFVSEYLHFQKMRYNERLNYEIEVDELIDLQMQVPKMMLFIHVENALRHGIFPKQEGGNLHI
ncbi:MAG: histidine kinase, partial [Bacteroidota bacterium]